MGLFLSTAPWLAGLLLTWHAAQIIARRLAYRRARLEKGCSLLRKYPHKEPFLGLDMFLAFAQAIPKGNLLPTVEGYFAKYGKTFQSNSWGTTVINTMDPRVIQTVLALEFDKFGVEPTRKAIVKPLMEDGIFTVDGEPWVHARANVKNIFAGIRGSTISNLEKHVNRLLELVPRDGETVDLQPLFKRMFLDKATEFLFGQSQDSLISGDSDPDSEDFISTFDRVLQGLNIRMFLGKFRFLRGRDTKWRQDLAKVHAFIDKYVDMALDRSKKTPQATDNSPYIFVDELVKTTQDRLELRNQMLNIFFPARDTTASAVSFVFFHLARNKRVWDKLRKEILDTASTPLTFDNLKSMKYLKYVISESLRLLAPAGLSIRTCLQDCILPYGGGPSGTQPLLVKRGIEIRIVFHALHKDPDIWGKDALEFRPERWETMRTTWEYIPFLGGGRICPAQQMVLTEISYIVVRFLQSFKEMENRDEQISFVEGHKMTMESKNGVKVGFVVA